VDELLDDELVAVLVLVLEDGAAAVVAEVSEATEASSSPEHAPATSANAVAATRRETGRRRMVIRGSP
jgi:hypothetical protein